MELSRNVVLVGNVVALVGAVLMVLVGFIKTKRNMLLMQNLQFLIMGIGNVILGGMTGAVADFVSIARNMVCLKWKMTLPWKIVFIGLQILFTLLVSDGRLIGWLPVIAAILFTWCLSSENEILLKCLIILAQIMWLIYDLDILNFTGAAFDAATVVSNIVGIIMILMGRKKEKTN